MREEQLSLPARILWLLVIIPGGMAAHLLLTNYAWVWYFVPLGAPPLDLARLVGLGAATRVLFGQWKTATTTTKETKYTQQYFVNLFVRFVLAPLVVFAMLWVLHLS